MAFKVKVTENVTPKLNNFLSKLPSNMKRAFTDFSNEWKKETQKNLSGSNTGRYPATRTGYLKSQVLPNGPQVSVSGKTYKANLIVDTPYAHVQNYGGTAGRYGSTVLKPRPYASDAIESTMKKFARIFNKVIMKPLRD